MGADLDTILPCRDFVVWVRDGEIRTGVPFSGKFVDTEHLSSIDLDFVLGLLAVGASPNGDTLWCYSAVLGALCRITLIGSQKCEIIWTGSDTLSISSIAIYNDRTFVVLQCLDQLKYRVCELIAGVLQPISEDRYFAGLHLTQGIGLNLYGLSDGIVIHDPVADRVWKWKPDCLPEVLSNSIDSNAILGVGQPFRVWSANSDVSGLLEALGECRRNTVFKMPDSSPLAGVVEYRRQVWGVSSNGAWASLLELSSTSGAGISPPFS